MDSEVHGLGALSFFAGERDRSQCFRTAGHVDPNRRGVVPGSVPGVQNPADLDPTQASHRSAKSGAELMWRVLTTCGVVLATLKNGSDVGSERTGATVEGLSELSDDVFWKCCDFSQNVQLAVDGHQSFPAQNGATVEMQLKSTGVPKDVVFRPVCFGLPTLQLQLLVNLDRLTASRARSSLPPRAGGISSRLD